MKIVLEKSFNSKPDKVFNHFTELEKAPERISGIEKLEILTEGPVGVGTQFKETRVMFGKTEEETMEIIEFQPGISYTLSCHSHGTLYKTHYHFFPTTSGTRVTMDFEASPESILAKILTPLSYIMKNSVVKCFENDLEDLKKALETI